MRRSIVPVLVIAAIGGTVSGASFQGTRDYDGKTLTEWVEQLKLGRNGGNFSIFEKIGVDAIPAIPSLAEMLKNPDYEVRLVTALAVREVAKTVVAAHRLAAPKAGPDPAVLKPVVGALIPLLGDADPNDRQQVVQSRAAWALKEAGGVAVADLVAAGRDASKPVMVRANAIRCLGEIGPAAVDALAALRALVNDKTADALIRGESNAAIKKIERAPESDPGRPHHR